MKNIEIIDIVGAIAIVIMLVSYYITFNELLHSQSEVYVTETIK